MKQVQVRLVARVLATLALLACVAGCQEAQVKQAPAKSRQSAAAPPPAARPNQAYTSKPAQAGGTGKVYMGREIAAMMGAAGGTWLERDSRQQEEQVSQAVARLPLRPDDVVADIGAGTGYFTFRMADRVPRGKVLAVEVQPEFIAALHKKKKELGKNQVEVIQGGIGNPNLPEDAVNLVLMVDVYHELEYPREMLAAIRRALRPDGKLVLLEYRAEDPLVPIRPLHKMKAAQVHREMEANGFTLFRQLDFLPQQHFLVYEKKEF
ncbi:MAG: class I SAM-dependent methyltransferase [Adhaeribacter sp.]